jgi:hypothetical protein
LEKGEALEARGRRALAWLCHYAECAEPASLPAPLDASRAIVVSGSDSDTREWLAGSAWFGVETRAVLGTGIPAEIRSGVALAAAVGLLASAARGEVLVVQGTGRRRRAIWLTGGEEA